VPALDVIPASAVWLGGAVVHEPSDGDRAVLEDAAALAAEHGLVATTALLRGNTADEIVAFADSHEVDLIVIGSRGHGPIANALLGSVSREVLSESRLPILIVRSAKAERPAAVGLGM
jgi:nucleotide-binding universal stress UspA family protein